MDFLSQSYPSLYILILEHFQLTGRIEDYMEKCKAFENITDKYSLYIQGYFLIWLDKQRQLGKLKQGIQIHLTIISFYSERQKMVIWP